MSDQSPMMKLWQMGEKEHPRFYLSVVLSVSGVLLGMLPYFASAKIIIALLAGRADPRYYASLCAVALGGYLARSVLYALSLSVSHKATFTVIKTVREQMLAKLPKLPLGTIIDSSSGELKQIIVDQTECMERPLAHLLPEMTANLVGPVCILIYLFVLDWRMALLSLVSLPIGMVFLSFVMRDYGARYKESVEINGAMNAAIVEYMSGIEVIKTFNQGERSYQKFSDKILANAACYYNWMRDCQFPVSLSKEISPTTMITILPVGWFFYLNGSLSVETFIMTILLSLGVAGPLLAAINFIDSLAKVGTTVETIEKILLSAEQQHSDQTVDLARTDIRLDNVTFAYHGDKNILNGVSLEIQPNTVNAFVGPSGGGKTTIARLIAGYWDLDQGEIKIGGVPTTEIPLSQLYDLVAFVAQDTYLFNDTVRENIRLGNVNATDAEVEEIARASGCHEFISRLENGYETLVGTNGSQLSGGEKQRIAIARAMLKDAPFIIFDEATAYIDPENEAVLQQAISKLIAGKTVIVIAHRLSTIQDADQIFLVSDGRIAAAGTHEELISRSDQYRAMWAAHMGIRTGESL